MSRYTARGPITADYLLVISRRESTTTPERPSRRPSARAAQARARGQRRRASRRSSGRLLRRAGPARLRGPNHLLPARPVTFEITVIRCCSSGTRGHGVLAAQAASCLTRRRRQPGTCCSRGRRASDSRHWQRATPDRRPLAQPDQGTTCRTVACGRERDRDKSRGRLGRCGPRARLMRPAARVSACARQGRRDREATIRSRPPDRGGMNRTWICG